MKSVRLKDLGRWFSGGTPPRDAEQHWSGALPWLSGKDFDSTRLREPTAFITEDAARLYSRLVPTGSLLLIVRGMALAHGLPVARTETRAAINQDLRALVCAPGIDSRFVFYGLIGNRQRLNAHIDRAAHGTARVTDSMFSERIRVPRAQEQKSIADFLDRECARIDELRGELDFLESSLAHASESSLAVLERAGVVLPPDLSDRPNWGRLPTGWEAVLLGRAVRQLTNGYVGPTRDVLVPDGVRYIQSTHIKGGRIEFDRRPFYVPEDWHDARPRIHLTAGDVLIVQTGKLGETALVPDDFGPASCHALLIARAEPSLMSGAYLAAWFSTYFGRHSLLRMATGALHPHLEAGEIRKLQILIPARDVQQEFVAAAGVGQARRRRMESEIYAFRRRLAEYRDALITEAVTGQLDVINLRDSEMAESLAAVGEGEPPGVLAR